MLLRRGARRPIKGIVITQLRKEEVLGRKRVT